LHFRSRRARDHARHDLGCRVAGAHRLRRVARFLDSAGFPAGCAEDPEDAPLNTIVLRPPLEVCAARTRDRTEGKITKYDRGFYAMFAAEERHVVSDESESPKAIAEILFKGLKESRFRVAPNASAPKS
jgi:hypothetical protein